MEQLSPGTTTTEPVLLSPGTAATEALTLGGRQALTGLLLKTSRAEASSGSSAVHKIVSGKLSAWKLLISAAEVLISPRCPSQPLSVGVSWLYVLMRPFLCLKEVCPWTHPGLPVAQLHLCMVLAKA